MDESRCFLDLIGVPVNSLALFVYLLLEMSGSNSKSFQKGHKLEQSLASAEAVNDLAIGCASSLFLFIRRVA